MSNNNGGKINMTDSLESLSGENRRDLIGFWPDNFDGLWPHAKDFDEVWAEMRHLLKDIELKGVMVLRGKLIPGHDNFRGSKLVSKRPVRNGWLEIPDKYELTLSLDMDGRELLDHKVLGPGIYLLKFDGCFGPYYAIGLAPDWNPKYKRPTLNFSDLYVAVSDRRPEKNAEYQCTVIKKRDDHSTAVESKTFQISDNVKNLGVNSALCELKDGEMLLVTWSYQQKT